MKLKGTRTSHAQRLNAKEKEKIVGWSRRRVPQAEMARALGTSVDTIRRQQKRMGCLVEYRRPIDDTLRQEILALRAEGLASQPIAERTGVGARTVLKVLRETGIEIKVRRRLSAETLAAIDGDLRGRKDFLCRIAKKYGVGLETVRRRKKKILGPAPLLSRWPPLRSKFSQIDAAAYVPSNEEVFLALVRNCINAVAEKYLRQGVDRDEVLLAMRTLKGDPTPVLSMFEARLRGAAESLDLAEIARHWTVH